ncbi:transposase [Methylomonas sp. MgM2]
MTNEKKHNRPKYSLEFKQDAAKLVLEKGYSQQQAADHLGVSLSAMGRWVRAERKPSTTKFFCEIGLNQISWSPFPWRTK